MPALHAVHECPAWPKWVLLDSPDVQEDLGLMIEPLQFYDIRNCQWVGCMPSYPHDVRRDGYLFLRRPSVTLCRDFESHYSQSLQGMQHFRDNLTKERADVRNMLANRRNTQPLHIIDLCDIDAEIGRRREKRVREHVREEDNDEPSSQRLRLSSPGPSIPSSPVTPAAISSAAVSQPFTSRNPYVPASCVRWPDNMYTVDMKSGFALIDSPTMKKQHARLTDRIAAVFQRHIPERTYYDQRRRWKQATEQQRQVFADAGHTQAGLWSSFPK